MFKKVTVLLLLAILFLTSNTHRRSPEQEYLFKQHEWVEAELGRMSIEEKIGQLFMIAAYSNKNEQHFAAIDHLVSNYNVGGLIFFQGGPGREASLTNRFQKLAKTPLMIGIDGEWGLAMRLDSTMKFPKQMTLGAIQNNDLIVQMGEAIGNQCKRIGIHVNFAPVIDVNVNPNNPVIGVRSFGSTKELVAQKGIAYMEGLQNVHVMANAKHFPGHGDTDADSHYNLPVIKHSRARIDSVELYPFKELFKDSLASVMVAHLQIPAIDPRANYATTLSPKAVTDILKKELKFEGLIFTDALNMKGVASYHAPGEVDLMAFKAGNDVLLFAEDVPKAIALFKASLERGEISERAIEERVRKILKAKYWVGLNNYSPINLAHLVKDLHKEKDEALRYQLFEKALTVVNNDDKLIPVRQLNGRRFSSVSIGRPKGNRFQRYLNKYASFNHYSIGLREPAQGNFDALYNKVKDDDVVVIAIHRIKNRSTGSFGIGAKIKPFVERLRKQTKVILVMFGSPYSVKKYADVSHLICAYEDNDVTQKTVPQLIFGAIGANGKLPVPLSELTPAGHGEVTYPIGRTGFDYPSNQNLNPNYLNGIDTIAINAGKKKATPGCQVLVMRGGKIVFNKSYGYQTYDSILPVSSNTIYDVASVTKVVATTQLLMELYSLGILDLDATLETYIPELKGTNKEGIVIRDILSHQAGLFPYISHWRKSLTDDSKLDNTLYCRMSDDSVYCNQISDSLYSVARIQDSVWKWTIESELIEKDKKTGAYPYRYSDVGYYFMVKVIEKLSKRPFVEYLEETIYGPLGLTRLTYLPLHKFDKSDIAPTEEDGYFRQHLIQGTVHDQGAAMMGGVAGHAGVFSNAEELAKILQMNLQGGTYGNRVYFVNNALKTFTTKQFEDNRRALGWDKPERTGYGPTSEYSSSNCFGHSGFTGTCVWVDPDYDLVYVFLSNRVYPTARNKKLIKTDVRTRIHDAIYASLVHTDRVTIQN